MRKVSFLLSAPPLVCSASCQVKVAVGFTWKHTQNMV